MDTHLQFVDATHVKAHANRHKNKQVLLKKQATIYPKKLEQEIMEDQKDHGKDELKPLRNPPADTTTTTQSTTGPESGLFHKGEHKEVFTYTVQTACDRHGWILACQSFPGNRHDSSTFFDFSQKLQALKPEKRLMDAGYKTPAIAKILLEEDILPVYPYTRQKQKPKLSNPYYKKEYIYDPHYDGYLCPEGAILSYSTTNRKGYREYKSNPKTYGHFPSHHRCTASRNSKK